MRLEDVLPALREGKKARRKSWPVVGTINILPSQSISLNAENILADDWEIVPEPSRVADYLVKVGYGNGIAVWYQYTHPIGQQPEGSVMVPGSERNATE